LAGEARRGTGRRVIGKTIEAGVERRGKGGEWCMQRKEGKRGKEGQRVKCYLTIASRGEARQSSQFRDSSGHGRQERQGRQMRDEWLA
jgi:hypothetical protein